MLTHTQVRKATSFIQKPQSYNAASGEIFGILAQMLETFETNLASAQKDEMAAQKSYEELKSSIEAEVNAAVTLKDTKTVELAEASEKLAMMKEV